MQLSNTQLSGPCKSAFDPLDLEVLEQVYESLWDAVRANDPFRNLRMDEDLQASIRRALFAYAAVKGTADPDALKEAVLSSMKPPHQAQVSGSSGAGRGPAP